MLWDLLANPQWQFCALVVLYLHHYKTHEVLQRLTIFRNVRPPKLPAILRCEIAVLFSVKQTWPLSVNRTRFRESVAHSVKSSRAKPASRLAIEAKTTFHKTQFSPLKYWLHLFPTLKSRISPENFTGAKMIHQNCPKQLPKQQKTCCLRCSHIMRFFS